MSDFKSSKLIYVLLFALAIFGTIGWSLALKQGGQANANETEVDEETLNELYDAVFHRPVDEGGRSFYLGRSLKIILKDFRNSAEMRYYGALFKAVKAYEEAQRAPGTLTEQEKQSYLDMIDSALSNLLAWVATLPDQNPCRAVIGPEVARTAVQAAYDRLDSSGKARADHGLLNAIKRIGPPSGIAVHPKCLRPTVTPVSSPTVTPTSTVTPVVTPTPAITTTPTVTPTVTPTITPTVTPTPTP